MDRVFPDSNVLYPISIADLTLRLADVALIEVIWSEDLLSEVERILVEYKDLSPLQADYFCRCIRTAFPQCEIRRPEYEHLIKSRHGPDPDDHPHAAAALAGRATVILTNDRSGFPPEDVAGIRVARPDDYLTELLETHTAEVLQIVDDMGSQRRQPQPADVTIKSLEHAGLTCFGRRASKLLGEQMA